MVAEAILAVRIGAGLLEDVRRPGSRPFPRPRTGKVAVKVINHHGDEVMKVLAVSRD